VRKIMKPEDEIILLEIMRTNFNAPELELKNDMTADQIPAWDSFAHIRLVLLIEEEFGIHFPTNLIHKLRDVGHMKEIISELINAK